MSEHQTFTPRLITELEQAITKRDERIARLEAGCRHDWRDVLEHLQMARALRAGWHDGGDPTYHVNTGCVICDTAARALLAETQEVRE